MRVVVSVLVLSVFVLSPNLLYLMGVPYTSASGSLIAKIHPATYLGTLLLIVMVARGARRPTYLSPTKIASYWMGGAAIFAMMVFSVNSRESGGELSGLIVTFLTPAIIALVLGYADRVTLNNCELLIGYLLIANSLLGVVEYLTDFRLLPFVAGDAVLTFDRRPTAILGHPLTNALVTGGWTLILFMRAFKSKFQISTFLAIGGHTAAMLVFGGRTSLVIMLLTAVAYVAYRMLAALSTGRGRAELTRSSMILVLAVAAVPIVGSTGLADGILARFEDGRGSNETRLAAVEMLNMMSPSEWWAGVAVSARTAMQLSTGSEHGIELSWIALILIFGLPLAALLISSMVNFLIAVGRGRGVEAALLTVYFLASTFTSLSIASKTLVLAQFFILLNFIPFKAGFTERENARSATLRSKV